MKREILFMLPVLCLASCSWFQNNPYEPVYNRPDSPLDPVGMAHHKREARDRASQGSFEVGSEVSVAKGMVTMFEKNPELYPSAAGFMEKAEKVKVLANDGSFVRVELPDGKVGFINGSDLVNPKALVPMIGPDGQPSLFDDSTFVGNLPAIGGDFTTANLLDGSTGDVNFVPAANKPLETRLPGAPASTQQTLQPKSSKVSDLSGKSVQGGSTLLQPAAKSNPLATPDVGTPPPLPDAANSSGAKKD